MILLRLNEELMMLLVGVLREALLLLPNGQSLAKMFLQENSSIIHIKYFKRSKRYEGKYMLDILFSLIKKSILG
jgi:hypothetical protein